MADTPLPPITVDPPPSANKRVKLGQRRIRTLPDPALSGNWVTYIEPGYSVEIIAEHVTAGTYKGGQAHARPAGGTMRWYPGTQSLDPLTIVFYEAYDYRVTRWLNIWKKQVFDPETGVYGQPYDEPNRPGYRREFKTEFLKYGTDDVQMDRIYLGCFPEETQAFELSYQEIDGRLTVSGQFHCNRLVENFYD